MKIDKTIKIRMKHKLQKSNWLCFHSKICIIAIFNAEITIKKNWKRCQFVYLTPHLNKLSDLYDIRNAIISSLEILYLIFSTQDITAAFKRMKNNRPFTLMIRWVYHSLYVDNILVSRFLFKVYILFFY